MKKNSPVYTVGIATCYGSQNLVETVKSIRQAKLGKTFSIIVVADSLPLSEDVKEQLTRLDVVYTENKERSSFLKKAEQIVNMVSTDMFILTQDDVRFEENAFVHIDNYYKTKPNTTFSMTRVDVEKSVGFFERVLESGTVLGLHIVDMWNNGANYLAGNGRCIIAPTSEWRMLEYHKDLVNIDCYIYLYTLFGKKQFGYINQAVVYITNPQKVDEYLKKADRFNNSRNELIKYFPKYKKNFSKIYSIPKIVVLRSIFFTIVKDPFFTILYLIFRTIVFLRKPSKKTQNLAVWSAEISTKTRHNYI